MTWTRQLLKTYENNKSEIRPLAHQFKNVQIEITLNRHSELVNATIVDKEDQKTLIPVTEESSGRSSDITPYPLSDQLCYIARDFKDYCSSEKEAQDAEQKNQKYLEQLRNWAESDYSHEIVKIIYRYLSQNNLISDLVKFGIIKLDDDGKLSKRISGKTCDKALVRFIVNGVDFENKVWENRGVTSSYTQYYLASRNGAKKELDYFTGDDCHYVIHKHPKHIISYGSNAKLISSDDNINFTYLGRFASADQAISLGYESSDKIHAALSWLVEKQGHDIGGNRKLVCWCPSKKGIPDVFDLFDNGHEDDEDNKQVQFDVHRRMIQTLQGYQTTFTSQDEIIVMILDAATKGRLSIIYYNEWPASKFIDYCIHWSETVRWVYRQYDVQKSKYVNIDKTPSFDLITKCAYGTLREETDGDQRKKGDARNKGAKRKKFLDVNEKTQKASNQRLISMMLENRPMDYDIVISLVRKASNLVAIDVPGIRELILSTACAVIQKYNMRFNDKEETSMELDKQNRDRSYLFGRLLAIYEKMERDTYSPNESRDPNAIRLQSAFVAHPFRIWKELDNLVSAYKGKLNSYQKIYYPKMISEIVALFKDEDQDILNTSLKETYLLGYYLQRAELYKKKETVEEE